MPTRSPESQVLKRLFGFFLLVILPAIIILWSIEAQISIKIRQNAIEIQRSLSAALYKLEPFGDDRRFFHAFLQKKFFQAQQAGDARIFHDEVKKNFGRRIKLIIWDSKGEIDQELSGELKFRYLMQKMWQAMRILTLEQEKEEPLLQQRLKDVSGNIELFRHYFGNFLTPEAMVRPLLKGLNGEAVFVSNAPDNGMLWYQFGHKFSAACILAKSLKDRHIGLENLCRRINANHQLKTGYYSLKKEKLFAPWLNNENSNEFLLEMQKFSDGNFDMQESKNYFWLFQQISPDLFIFSAFSRNQSIQYREELLQKIFTLIKFLLIILFLAYCASLRFEFSFSIKLRFILIFCFSSGLPLLLLLSSCYEYFNFQKSNLIFAQHHRANRMMREFDGRFVKFQEKIAHDLNDLLKRYESNYPASVWPQEAISDLEKDLSSFQAGEYLLAKPGEGSFFYGGKKLYEDSYKNIAMTFSAILAALNRSAQISSSYFEHNLAGFATEYDFTTDILDDLGKISNRTFKTGLRKVYMNSLGLRRENHAWAMLVMSWEPIYLQNLFVTEELKKFNQEFEPGILFSSENSGRHTNFTAGNLPEQLHEIFARTQKDKFVFADDVIIGSQQYIVTGMSAYHLSNQTLIAIFPDQALFAQLYRLAKQIIFGVFVVAVTLLVAVFRFSRSMLMPLQQIEEGLMQIQKRNFHNRLVINDGSELGELASAFNTAIESMADLSLGTSVQAALLPPSLKIDQCFEIHSKVRYMTTMGGDFCDYTHSQDTIHIAFGDVAGHGIPAALIMAMIKAYLPENELPPAKFLEDCNKVFLYLREKNWRRMMTLASLRVCLKTGEAVLANAGHCFPILLNSEKGEARFVETKGIPLGSKHAKNYVESSFSMQPGEKLLFYSDGFIEDVNEKEESFGYERFLQLIVSNVEKCPAELLETVFTTNQNWAVKQNDDLSLLCFHFKKINV